MVLRLHSQTGQITDNERVLFVGFGPVQGNAIRQVMELQLA